MFSLNEKVVYPGHGVASISRLITKSMAGKEALFYELAFLNKDVTVLVPIYNADSIGIRRLSTEEHIYGVFKALVEPVQRIYSYEFTASNWNKRNKEYQNKLRTGSLKDLSEIYRDLRHIATQKELSFGEKNLLHQAEMLLVEEIALVRQLPEEKVIEQLRSLCTGHQQKHNTKELQRIKYIE
jgi:CarD family transcriptional regulator